MNLPIGRQGPSIYYVLGEAARWWGTHVGKEVPSREEADQLGAMTSLSDGSAEQQGTGGSGASLRRFREM